MKHMVETNFMDFMAEQLKDPALKAEYDALAPEYDALQTDLDAQIAAEKRAWPVSHHRKSAPVRSSASASV